MTITHEQAALGPYYAKNGKVWKHAISRKVNGGQSITMGFPVCVMHDAVREDAAQTVADLMNAGHVALAKAEVAGS
jgi:hypothetical protein